MNPPLIDVLIDSMHGSRHIPKIFSGFEGWRGVSLLDREFLMKGPEHEGYWPAWDRILYEATMEIDGYAYRLHQRDGDLFAYRDPATEREAEQLREFFGWERGGRA